MRAEMLTYSRARGLFAGISLAGSTVRPDNDANERILRKESFREGHRAARCGAPHGGRLAAA